MSNLEHQLKLVKAGRQVLAALPVAKRNRILQDIAKDIKKNQKAIIKENEKDLKYLQRQEMRDRLVLNPKRINGMAQGLSDVARLPEVLNKVLEIRKPKNGLLIKKVTVPLGTLGVIYESRPNVTVDLAGLSIKSGNAIVLKGGREAYQSNKVLVGLIHQVLKKHHLPTNLVYLINPKENWQKVLLNAHNLVDVIIPRGSSRLIDWVRQNSRLPIIETGAGVCHTFVDAGYDPKTAANIIVNAKTQRPDVCNALDTLVIHERMLESVLSRAVLKLVEYGVEIFADQASYNFLKAIYPSNLLKRATPKHYGQEFLSLKMAIKTVKSFEQGLKFIKEKTSGHSEAVLSPESKHINKFLDEVDAAAVYANASTRFTDGGEFGMGAEVGISTQKLHARGPVGLEALVSYKWKVLGKGQSRK